MSEISRLLDEIEADLKALHNAIEQNEQLDNTCFWKDVLSSLKPEGEPDPAIMAEKEVIAKQQAQLNGLFSQIKDKFAKIDELMGAGSCRKPK